MACRAVLGTVPPAGAAEDPLGCPTDNPPTVSATAINASAARRMTVPYLQGGNATVYVSVGRSENVMTTCLKLRESPNSSVS